MNQHHITADRLILCCRALVEGSQGAAASSLRDALQTLRPHLGRAALDEARDVLMLDLVQEGAVVAQGRRYVLESPERERLSRLLGLPRTASVKWTRLRDVFLLAHALGLAPPGPKEVERFAKAPNCRAAVITAAHDLALEGYPSSTQVLDTLTWNRLENLSGGPVGEWRKHAVGGGKVVSFLLLDPLGVHAPRTAAQMLSLLARTAVDAVGDGLPALRSAVLQRWREHGPLRAGNAAQIAGANPSQGSMSSPHSFVNGLRAMAETEALTQRADRGIFVAALFEAARRRAPHLAEDLQSFKQRLLSASRAGELRLMRADLVEAMDGALIERSEIRDLHARFHLVVLPGDAQ